MTDEQFREEYQRIENEFQTECKRIEQAFIDAEKILTNTINKINESYYEALKRIEQFSL